MDTSREPLSLSSFPELCDSVWKGRIHIRGAREGEICHLDCRPEDLRRLCEWLSHDIDYVFATLVVEEVPGAGWSLAYVFYRDADWPWVYVELHLEAQAPVVPSISGLSYGPSIDWHEREVEDLFGLMFEGHPRLGEFILHEDWPEGVNPMRLGFDAQQPFKRRELDPTWQPPTVVTAPGAFAMPVGPVFSDFAESAHFLLETVGEDVIRTIPRLFYKYRGIEKIVEGQTVDSALLLAERFTGTAAFAHGMAFCRAVEAIHNIQVPPRAEMLRTVFAELERLRHHAAAITGICNSTALTVAASQAAIIEEDLLRLSCQVAGHRYLFGVVSCGGLTLNLSDEQCGHLTTTIDSSVRRLGALHEMLRYSSSFLDRIEEVGILSTQAALSYGVVGPVARASGVGRDIRKLRPYGAYAAVNFTIPIEQEGDGYARLRVLFQEADQSASIIRQLLPLLPRGPVSALCSAKAGSAQSEGQALTAVEAPLGAAFHWLRLKGDGTVSRCRITPPSFSNWHGFHLAAENFTFQDFPIILATFGLSNAECDR